MDVYQIFKRYKTKVKDNQIFDPIRNKFVALTPEEQVRQKTIQFLIRHMHVPADQLGIEVALSTLGDKGNRKRIDICIFDSEKRLRGIVECKANYIGYGEAPYQQALDYVTTIGARCYFVVDGRDMIGYYYDSQNDQFVQMDAIPTYDELLQF
jgi:hypothetical protein